MKFGDTFYFFFLRESMAVLSGCKCQKCLEDRNLLDIPVDTKDEKRLQYIIARTSAEVISSMAPFRGSHLYLKRTRY